jgi:HK97 family phage major capsid protein/HK97 family phage prohead protease
MNQQTQQTQPKQEKQQPMAPEKAALLQKIKGTRAKRDAAGDSPVPVQRHIARLLELQGERGRMARQATFDQQTINVEQRTVEIAFSSEVEVTQWFGIEVLDHSPGAVDLNRLNDSAALLVNHDWDDQVGVVVSASIDSDRRGRAVVRFGRSPRAEEVFQDVIDGIRKHISVGYQIIDAKLTEERDTVDVWTITSWAPYEISFVSVPADISVGVGRSMGKPQEEPPASATDTSTQVRTEPVIKVTNTMEEKTLRDAKGNLVRAMVDANGKIVEVLEVVEAAGNTNEAAQRSGGEAAQRRVNAILEMGERFNARDDALTFARDSNKTPADFQAHLLEKLNQRTAMPLNEQTRSADVGLTQREIEQFSFIKVVRAMADPTDTGARKAAAFEFDVSNAARDKSGKPGDKFMIPADVLRSAIGTTMASRVVSAGTNGQSGAGASGGNLIATNLLAASFIDILRNKTTIMKMGRVLGGLVGNIDIPKQNTKGQGYWLGEDDAAPENNIDFGQVALSPKTAAAYSDVTRKLLKQGTPDAEALLRYDLAASLALTLDLAGYYGTGTANQPLGIANQTGIHAVGFVGTQPMFAELVEMETAVALDNADVDTMAYVSNAAFRGYAKTTLKFPGSASAATIWEPGSTVNGYTTEITNQISTGDVFMGNFADLLIGMWGGLEMQVDPFTNSTKGRIRTIVFQDVDYALRRVQSFTLGRKAA